MYREDQYLQSNTDPSEFKINELAKWLANGAQPTK